MTIAAVTVLAVVVLAVLLVTGRSVMRRPSQIAKCVLPERIVHSTITIVLPGANGDAETGRELFAWLEDRYGHVVVCDYGRTSFHGDAAAQLLTAQLLPLKDHQGQIVLIGCSKGLLTMLDVLACLHEHGFDTERICIGVVDGAVGTEHTILVSSAWLRWVQLVRWLPVGRIASVFPGRLIMRRLGSPDYQLSHLVGHIRHVLARSTSLPTLFAHVNKMVYLVGGARDNKVLRQPSEWKRVHGVAVAAGVDFTLIHVAGGGHCDFDERPEVWKREMVKIYDEFGIDPIAYRSNDIAV